MKIKIETIYHKNSQMLIYYDKNKSHIVEQDVLIDTSKKLLDTLNDKFRVCNLNSVRFFLP